MRVWDIPVRDLCDRHLLGEHAELHAVWNIITGGKKGYSAHPETLRWQGRLRALYSRHEEEAGEMKKRGFRHGSILQKALATGRRQQTKLVDTIEEQRRILKGKGCGCFG
jgi:pyrimidine dimer DNA glycosylase